MTTPDPTAQQIDELLSFLPRLYGDGFVPVKAWHGGAKEDGTMTLPWPEYHELVPQFFAAAAAECWRDYQYDMTQAWQMLADEPLVKQASLAQIKTMLTYCVRGERFSDGHWGMMIEEGHIRRLLERLAVLQENQGNG
ncbi:MAG: hypothetical protein KJ063_13890 [Anaerolineae bacterium]|nr:hypothetical protein [Anaerolineae bacterium]